MKIMVYNGPKELEVTEAPDLAVYDNQIKIETICSGISHGTEMNVYRGSAPFFNKKSDPADRLFKPAGENETWKYPIRSCDPGVWYMGYAGVGKVVAVGNAVTKFKVGDIAYASFPHQSEAVVNEADAIKLPEGMKPEHGVFFTNLMTSFNGILDSDIKLGDTVVVSGLGVLGQLVAQMAKMSGAFCVIAIDPIEKRRTAAMENGADYTFDPMSGTDVAEEIRKLTNNVGPDVVIEVTGNSHALNQAIRIAAPNTTVIALGWYQGVLAGVNLAEEFHHNRISIRCSQTNGMPIHLSHMWDNNRRIASCMKVLESLKLDNLITRVKYDDIAKAYETIDKNPEQVIQVLVEY